MIVFTKGLQEGCIKDIIPSTVSTLLGSFGTAGSVDSDGTQLAKRLIRRLGKRLDSVNGFEWALAAVVSECQEAPSPSGVDRGLLFKKEGRAVLS